MVICHSRFKTLTSDVGSKNVPDSYYSLGMIKLQIKIGARKRKLMICFPEAALNPGKFFREAPDDRVPAAAWDQYNKTFFARTDGPVIRAMFTREHSLT